MNRPPRRFPADWREFLGPALALAAIFILLAALSHRAAQKATPATAFPTHSAPAMQEIRLEIRKKGMWKLRALREEALRIGVLMEGDDPWVNATLHEGEREWPIRLRLKGDWTDHLRAGKWSFRVQVRRGLAYRRMSAFSLQHPGTREFLNEWLFHLALQEEDVLCPRYDFVRLVVNGNQLGIYALEEHFTPELLAALHRPDGPLLKFAEEGMWEARVRALADTLFPYTRLPLFESAQVEPFQVGRTLRDPVAKAQFDQAHILMHQYRHGARPAADIFDLDAVARQYALTDLFGGHHSLIWHNRRYYYDPIAARLEPVVFDAFAGNDGLYLNGPFTGYASNGHTSYGRAEDILGTLFFQDTAFVRAYYQLLHRYSDPDWIARLLDRHADAMAERTRFLRREFLFYRFAPQLLTDNARRIREALAFSPQHIHWDSTAAAPTGWVYCIQNRGPVAVDVAGTLLDAYDGQNPAAWVEVPGQTRPPVRGAWE